MSRKDCHLQSKLLIKPKYFHKSTYTNNFLILLELVGIIIFKNKLKNLLCIIPIRSYLSILDSVIFENYR